MDYREKYEQAIKRAKAMIKVANNQEEIYNSVITIFPELKESEDERIRKDMVDFFKGFYDNPNIKAIGVEPWLAWLEKQGEQKPADKDEPKFKEGNWVVYDHRAYQVVELPKEGYINLGLRRNEKIEFAPSSYCRPWTIQDAKGGDVLATKAGGIFIYKELLYDKPFAYCGVDKFGVFKDCNCGDGLDWTPYLSDVTPATKEQRDLLFQKMHEEGYEWDAEKKELKKIEDEEYNGEDYGIDSLFHAQRILEKTLGSVDGYQSDDGILEHKCAISAVKKLYEQKPAQSEEDKDMVRYIGNAITCNESAKYLEEKGIDMIKAHRWLESLEPQPKQEWSEEDEMMIKFALTHFRMEGATEDSDIIKWLKSIRPQKQWKPSEKQNLAWSEEDETNFVRALAFINNTSLKDVDEIKESVLTWLKSLRTQTTWKPSDEQLKSLQEVIDVGHFTSYSNALETLYEQLKKLREE